MERRREQLVRILERRRRMRLMLVCLVTALACGAAAGVVAPQLLIGGMPSAAGNDAAKLDDRAVSARPAPQPLDLSERLALDPRETRANAVEWARMAEADRRALLDRYWRLSEMGPADQERVFQRYALLRELPGNRQDFLRTRAVKLTEFVKTLSPQDQAVLESMSDRDRAKRLLELWQARYGAW